MAGELHDWLINEVRVPTVAPPELHPAIQGMLGELMSQRLEVGLAPSQHPEVAQRGGKVRQVLSQNPDWYRKFAAQFTANRSVPRTKLAHDTLIKRQDVLRTLQGLLGPGTFSSYAPKLIEAARAYQAARDEEDAYWRAKADELPTNDPITPQATPAEIDEMSPF